MPISGRSLRPSSTFTPRSVPGLALWLDSADVSTLYTTDAGPVVPVNAPTDIAGCSLWLDGDDLATITKDGSNFVSQWNDKSGNSRHATASGSNRPTWTAAAQNGRATLAFDGTSSQMKIASTFLVTDNATIFAVARYVSGAFGAVITSKGSGDTSPSVMHTNGTWQANARTNTATGVTFSGYGILASTVNAGAVSLAQDGLVRASTAVSGSLSSDATTTSIGSYREAVLNLLHGNIAEIICFNSALSAVDRARVEAYLAAKWGITGVHRPVTQELTAVSSPLELANCAAWFDASDAATLFDADTGSTPATTTVGRWANKGSLGASADLVQATPGSRPSITAAALNGRPVLTFDGTADFLRSGAFTLPQPFEYYMVFRFDSQVVVSNPRIFDAGAQPGTRAGEVYRQDANIMGVFSGSANTATVTSANFAAFGLYTISFNGTSSYIRYGGGAIQSNLTAGTNNGSRFTLGADSNATAGLFSSISVAEIIVFSAALSAVDRARVERYLASKYGIASIPEPSPPVGYWADKSGNNRHATQATGTSRPSIAASNINGRRSISFSTASTAQRIGWNPSSGTQNWQEVFQVGAHDLGASTFSDLHSTFSGFATNAGTGNGVGWIGLQSTNTIEGSATFLPLSNLNTPGHVANGLVRPFPTINSPFVLTARATEVTVAVAGYIVGNDRQVASGRNWRGRIVETIAFERTLTATERSRIIRYLAAKYGIALAPVVSNPDAQDWVNRVYANGGTVSASTAAAVNQFCIDTLSIRDRFLRLNLFCGGTSGTAIGLNSCLVPLYRGQSLGGTQHGGATDLNTGGGLFVGGDYVETGAGGGLSPSGSGSKRLDTGLTQVTVGVSSCHLAVYEIAKPTSGLTYRCRIGCRGASSLNDHMLENLGTDPVAYATGGSISGRATAASYAEAGAFWLGSNESTTTSQIYKNGTLAGSATPTARTAQALNYWVFGLNDNGALGDVMTVGRLGGYSIGLSMDAGQVSTYTAAMQAFQAALGRAV